MPGTDTAATDSVAASAKAKAAQGLSELKNMSLDDLISRLANDLVEFAIHLAIAILVFYVGKYIIKKVYTITGSIMARRNVERSLTTFVLSLVRIVLYFILIVTVIGILGINTSSFIAIFASVGVAIGMALSGTLQNFAGGVLILLLKPYRIGDYIETQGFAGTVTEIQIFSTVICTPDNKSILIPNGGLSTGSINNWSRQEYRRVDWNIGISYGDDFNTAASAILAIINSNPLVMHTDGSAATANPDDEAGMVVMPATKASDNAPAGEGSVAAGDAASGEGANANGQSSPVAAAKTHMGWIKRMFSRHRQKLREREERHAAAVEAILSRPISEPTVHISELADSSVNLTVRAWVKSADYWSVYYTVIERVYAELPATGVSFPFPQLDVHLTKNA